MAITGEMEGVQHIWIYRYDMLGEGELLDVMREQVADPGHPMNGAGLLAIKKQL